MLKKLRYNAVEKPWGRTDLPEIFDVGHRRIGEILHKDVDSGAEHFLAVKHIFTAERLSIQVHPDDQAARRVGFPRGKDEAWYILDCAAGAVIGLGLKQAMSTMHVKNAISCGDIIEMIDWKPVSAGDFIYVPAGTIHAIGADISLIEIQTNIDITYRLFDYGRDRELQLEQGLAVSQFDRYDLRENSPAGTAMPFWIRKEVSAEAGALSLPGNDPVWFVPIAGGGEIDGQPWVPNQCWLTTDASQIRWNEAAAFLLAGAAN